MEPIKMGIAFDVNEQPWAQSWKKALFRGVQANGDIPRMVPARQIRGGEWDVTVTWGLRGGRLGIMRSSIDRGKRHLVMERGFIGDREKWTALSFDGIAGRGSFPALSDPLRFNRLHKHLMKPWRGDVPRRALVMGQVIGDATTRHVDLWAWTLAIIDRLRREGWEVHYRPHPWDVSKHRAKIPPGVVAANPGPIDAALARAGLVVTFNSTSAANSVLSGVRTFAQDEGSPAWDVTSRELVPTEFDRAAWADATSWKQWGLEEIESGEAWFHLKRIARR